MGSRTKQGSRGRTWFHALGVASLVVALSACTLVPREGGGLPGSHGWRPRLPALHAEPDPVSGGRMVDASGREVLLRGVNVNALVEYWQYGSFPTTFPLTDHDADLIAATGWNTVRLLVSWSRVEPSPGVYDERYLDQVARDGPDVRAVAASTPSSTSTRTRGARRSPRPPARPVPRAPSLRSAGTAHPGGRPWTAARRAAFPAGIRELSPAVRAAFSAFWDDAPGPGGVGIRTRYAAHGRPRRAALRPRPGGRRLRRHERAQRVRHDRGRGAVGALYAEAVAAIRAGERSPAGFPHLVFFEPSATWSDTGGGAPPSFPHDATSSSRPHIYRGGLTSGPITRSDFERARADAATFGGVPVFVGEWGSGPSRADDPARRLLPRAPGAPGRVPLRGDAVDLARVVRRPPQGRGGAGRTGAVRLG